VLGLFASRHSVLVNIFVYHLIRTCVIICAVNCTIALYSVVLFKQSHRPTWTHKRMYSVCAAPCHEYHTNKPYTPCTHVRLIGSYEKTGWTDQLSRPKKKPRTRFQTLPTSPGGPIIGKSCTVRIDWMMFHTCWFSCLKMKENFEILLNTETTTI
jgi:hypothetical protein